MKQGTFFAVGVGPGDPELITVKAVRILSECPVLAPPQTKNGDMLALEILKGTVDVSGKVILPIRFAMSRDRAAREKAHLRAADEICAYLERGMDVAMPNLGDVSIFATGSYLAELLKGRGFETVMIPGVTSFSAIGAALGESLTEMDKPLHILPAGAMDRKSALDWPGTKVLMKSGKQARALRDALLEREIPAVAVENCGLPGERIYRELCEMPDEPGYFTTLIVKEPNV